MYCLRPVVTKVLWSSKLNATHSILVLFKQLLIIIVKYPLLCLIEDSISQTL